MASDIEKKSAIKQAIEQAIKDAMRARDKQRLSALRLCLSAIKQYEIDKRIVAEDAHVVAVLRQLAKQRRASITEYEKAERHDLVLGETFELELILSYLPQGLSPEKIEALVTDVIAETGAQQMRDMGKVMAGLAKRLGVGADMAPLAALVKERLK